MSRLDDDIRAANALGISYGKYKALTYDPNQTMAPPKRRKRRGPARRFTDPQAFALWQAGMNDTDIAKALGVSQQTITNWRTTLELPLLSKNLADTTKYRLAQMPDGTYIAVHIDEI